MHVSPGHGAPTPCDLRHDHNDHYDRYDQILAGHRRRT